MKNYDVIYQGRDSKHTIHVRAETPESARRQADRLVAWYGFKYTIHVETVERTRRVVI